MLALAAAVALPLEARAQDCAEAPERTLRGHTFMYPGIIDSAFIDTLFAVRTTGRYEKVQNIPIGNGTTDVSSFDLGEGVDFALKLGDRFNVGVGLIGRGVVGLNGRAIATQGVLYSYGANVDAGFRIARIEESGTQIGVRGELFGVQGGGRISLLPFIRAVRDDPTRDVAAALLSFGDLIVTPISRLGAAASLNVAQVISPVFSVQASFRLDWRRTTESPYDPTVRGRVDVSSNAWIPQAGVAVGMLPIDWPVAFGAEYRISAQDKESTTSPARHVALLEAYYAGRPDLQVGPIVAVEFGLPAIQGIDANGNPLGSDKGTATSGQLVMRYFW
jgi:hypothetical protein